MAFGWASCAGFVYIFIFFAAGLSVKSLKIESPAARALEG